MEKRLTQITNILIIIGLLVSIYMTIYKITSNENMCIGSKDCSIVNASRFSEVNGVPVAVIGVAGYAALLALQILEKKPGFFQQNGTMIFFGIAVTGFLFTAYLIFVEVTLLKAFCPFCITSQVSMTLIFFISVIRLIKQP
jgi:uncharacterized membrane protein